MYILVARLYKNVSFIPMPFTIDFHYTCIIYMPFICFFTNIGLSYNNFVLNESMSQLNLYRTNIPVNARVTVFYAETTFSQTTICFKWNNISKRFLLSEHPFNFSLQSLTHTHKGVMQHYFPLLKGKSVFLLIVLPWVQ